MGERITLEGATNFRDLGGYRAEDRRTVRRGRVFRSDALHRLTDHDHRVLAALGIRLGCDRRYREQRVGFTETRRAALRERLLE